MDRVPGRDSVNQKGFGDDANDSREVRVVRAEDDWVVGLDKVAQVAVNVGRFVDIFGDRQPREPENICSEISTTVKCSHEQARHYDRTKSYTRGLNMSRLSSSLITIMVIYS